MTERQLEVYQLIVQGVKQEVIALMLNISVKTVNFHVGNIKAKLKVRKTNDLALKLIDPDGSLLKAKLRELEAANDPNYNEPNEGKKDRRAA